MSWKVAPIGRGGDLLYSQAGTPSLDLRFAETKSLTDYISAQNLITFSRSSSATYVGSDGLIKTSPTNLLTYSEEFDNAAYIKDAGVSVTPNNTESPDGSSTADLINVTDSGRLYANNTSVTGVCSVYIKAGTFSHFRIHGGSVDLTVPSNSAGTVTSVGNGWYRVVSNERTSNRHFQIQAYPDNTYSVHSSSGSYYIWGAQLEEGTTATDYIPTTNVPSAAPRFDHDPTTGECLGLLVEESRTNLVTYSEQFDNAAWVSNSAITITPNADTAPDGTMTADKATVNVGKSSWYLIRTLGSSPSAAACTVYAKAAGWNYISVGRGFVFGSGDYAIFDLQTGVVSRNPTYSGSAASIVYIGNGWYRCTLLSSQTTDRFHVTPQGLGTAANTGSPDGISGVLIWGAQLEAGSFPTSYIPTPATFTSRSTTATYYDANGTIQTAGIDVARDATYFPDENGVMRPAGLLLEAAGTNLVTYSQNMAGTGWTTSGQNTPLLNATTAPDGTTTANLLTENTSTGVHQLYKTLTVAPGNVTYSAFFKAKERSKVVLTRSSVGRVFDLTSGTSSTFSTDPVSWSMIKLSGGWYRCSITINEPASIGQWFMYLHNGTTHSYTGDGTSGVYVWGAQAEQSPYPTSYIPTTSSTVTRAADVSSSSTVTRSADVAQITGTNFSSWYNQSEGTIFASVRTVTPASVSNGLLQFTDGTSNNRIELGQGGSGDPYPRVRGLYRYLNSTTGTFINQETGWNTNGKTLDNWALAFDSSGFTFETKFDSTPTTGTGTYPQNLTQFSLGHRGTISRLTYYPVRLADSVLQAITQ